MERQGHFNSVEEIAREGAKYKMRLQLQEDLGLCLPKPQRNLRWTYNALTFNWGKMEIWLHDVQSGMSEKLMYEVKEVILAYFPNTLMLIGTANLIAFVVGIPLALSTASRKRGFLVDRIITMLSPISSVPSWVHGVLLIAVFSLQLKLLPPFGKYGILPPETWIENVRVVGEHMVLPVLAIFLGMFFQLVYAWRTYLMIYAEEDYVELAKAKGIPQSELERNYVLRPALPFILTSFAMTLVGFWQMTTAVEKFFYWPGLGNLFLKSLPQYLEEAFFPGNVGVVLSVVAIFAYLLGFTVLILDLIYIWVDPRLRLASNRDLQTASVSPRVRWRNFIRRKLWQVKSIQQKPSLADWLRAKREWISRLPHNVQIAVRSSLTGLRRTVREVLRYPSAVMGLFVICILVLGSVYAVIAYPYIEIGEEWGRTELTGRSTNPRKVPAIWINWFRRRDYPTTIVQSTVDDSITKSLHTLDNGQTLIVLTSSLDYPFEEFPQDMVLHIDVEYREKAPHLFISWITPDGRELSLKSPAVKSQLNYFFSEQIHARKYVRQNVQWEKWFAFDGPNPTPAFYPLLADPEADEPLALPGTYQLQISALTFEEFTDIEIEFVVFGRAFGWAGTDYLRRDLLVPLLWGMPIALAFGLTGAILTTILGMIIAAAGAWFGGWVDGLAQRLIEVNMILPILAVGVLIFFLYDISLWAILLFVVGLNIFGSPTKSFRAAFLQAKEAPYVEASRAYGASNVRIIFKYLIPRIMPTVIPQLVALIPSMVFLEATLSILGVFDPRFPTWGRVIHDAIEEKAMWGGSQYWVLEPITLVLLTGLAFAMLGFALERVLNPRLQTK
jgi:peptide/nickel transport system permease protein